VKQASVATIVADQSSADWTRAKALVGTNGAGNEGFCTLINSANPPVRPGGDFLIRSIACCKNPPSHPALRERP
jgi:hypothetical protein